MADIYLQGATYTGVPAVELPTTDNSIATFYEMTQKWLPPGAELVSSATETINVSTDTSYDSWTPSTTNTSILAVGTTRGACSYKITSDYQTTSLIGFNLYHTEMVYPDGTTYAKGYNLTKDVMGIGFYAPMGFGQYSNDYYGRVVAGVVGTSTYYSSASAIGVYASTNYGISPTTCTWSTSSATSTSARTVGFTRPIVYARCNSTYFSTAAASALDSANTNITCKYLIYAMDKTENPFYALFDKTNGYFFT